MTTTSAVLIVGGGLGGLTCARELLRRNITATVLEADDDVGGRVRSDLVGGFVLDRGFQVLFDAYPAVRRQLDLAALELRFFDPGALICRGERRFVLTDPLRDRDLFDVLAAAATPLVSPIDKARTLALALTLQRSSVAQTLAGDDEPTVEYLRRWGFSERCIDAFFRPFYGGIFLDRSLQTSAKCFRFDFKMLSDGGTCLPARGIGQIAQQLAAPLKARGLVRTGARVAALVREAGRVVGVRLSDGQELRADAVVVATPAPEAARLTEQPMPRGSLSVATVYFAGAQAVYRGRKIILNANNDAFVNNAQQLSAVAPEYAPPGRHLLGATVLGNPQMDDAQLARAALADLRRMWAGDARALHALNGYYPFKVYRIPYAQFAQPPGIHPHLPENSSGEKGLYFAAEFTEASALNAAMVSGEKCAELVQMQIAH
jgi:phytoene dehydrogenase-like protein